MNTTNRHSFYLNKAARYWDDGLPLGNGRLGAMIMGKTDEETIIINEETLWYGKNRNRKNPDTKEYLHQIRSLLNEGEVPKAQFLAKMAMTSTPKYMNPYQPAGDLRLCFLDHKKPVSNYKRSLDFDQAMAVVSYEMDGIRYKREHFVSFDYQIFATKITCDKQKKLTLSVNMSRKPFEENTKKLDEKTVCNYGQCGTDGISYFTGVRMQAIGGTVHTIGDFVYVENASEVYLYVTCVTNYEELAQKDSSYKDSSQEERAIALLDQAEEAGYKTLKEKHLSTYQSLYGRMDFQLGKEPLPDLSLDKLLNQIREANNQEENEQEKNKQGVNDQEANDQEVNDQEANDQEANDQEKNKQKTNKQIINGLTELLFHYARYLMISSSYGCKMPSNLQGIWNGDYSPPWQCEFTININTQMNYWIAEKCNLPECHKPLFEQLKRMVETGKKTAKELYDCEGFCAHHNTNIWANTDPEGIFDASPFWPMGAAWLSLHLFEHYRYTKDLLFLKEEALPIMREAIQFFEGYLTKTKDGTYVTGPSVSPENTYRSFTGKKGALCMGPAMDIQILKQLIKDYLEGVSISQQTEEESDAQICKEMMKYLPEMKVTSDGRIMEWQEEYEEMEPGHRHISHLFALHPGRTIREEDAYYFAAAKKTLEHRLVHGGGHTGWSRAWITCFYARLKEGESVFQSIKSMLATCIKDNLLDTHPPFQIDGNFGVAEGILESLVQSHSGYLEFLPALPKEWTEGYIKGMILAGGIVTDFSWKEGKLETLALTPKEDCKVFIKVQGIYMEWKLKAGQKREERLCQ